ncbi:hypothetical protein BC835DRAFT_1399201, partial [Cytidiella melzeri]
MYLSLTLYSTSLSLITLTGSDSTLTPSHHCSMPAHPPSSLWCLRILIIVSVVLLNPQVMVKVILQSRNVVVVLYYSAIASMYTLFDRMVASTTRCIVARTG